MSAQLTRPTSSHADAGYVIAAHLPKWKNLRKVEVEAMNPVPILLSARSCDKVDEVVIRNAKHCMVGCLPQSRLFHSQCLEGWDESPLPSIMLLLRDVAGVSLLIPYTPCLQWHLISPLFLDVLFFHTTLPCPMIASTASGTCLQSHL